MKTLPDLVRLEGRERLRRAIIGTRSTKPYPIQGSAKNSRMTRSGMKGRYRYPEKLETMKKTGSNKQNTYVNRTTYNRSRQSRTHYKKSFAMDIYRDPDLDFSDIGLLTWMLSNSKTYIINKNRVQQRSGLPEKKFLASWKKLQESGYVVKIPFQGGVEWVINEMPRS